MEYRIFSLLVIGLGVISSYSAAEENALWGPGTTVNSGVPISLPPSIEGDTTSADFSNIISNTTTSAIFSGADKITESLLSTLSDSGLSSGAISTISSRVKQRMANLSIQSGTASVGNFGKDVIVGMLVDFVAEEAMNYQIQRGGNFSTVRAATTYVLIKQSYIVATSKGPVGVIVGQAGLMRDIALKDIQAFQEYTEARELAEHAELRADMWDAYGDFILSYQAARTPQEQDDAANDFQIRLENIASQRDLFDIIAPSAGALNTPGNRPGDNRNASSLSALYEDLVLNFSGLQREFLENQKYNPLAPYAVPDFDIKSILSEPIIGEIAQEGTVNEFIALSGNDLQNEQTVLVAEFASPDDDTGTPGVDGGGDEGGGGDDGGQDGDRDPVDPEEPTSDITNVVVSTVSLPVSDGSIRYSGPLISEDGNTIRYDYWGIDQSQSAKIEGFNHLYWGTGNDGLQWIYGVASTPEQFALRTGTATFNGGLSGYYAQGTFDSNTVYEDSIMGELALNIDFGNNRLTGEGRVEIDTLVRSETLSFSLNQADITASNSGLTRSLGFSTNASLDDGVVGSGNFSGTFYGADASEAAGSFAFGLVGGFAAGVWAAGENFDPNQNDGPVGRITSQSLSRFITDAGISSGEDTDPTFTDVPVDQGAGGGEVRLVNKFNSDSATDPYTYTSWGDWVANDNTIPNFSEGGYWVTADTMTPASVIENRTGTASYSGDIVGDYVSNGARQDATGLINLTADFSADTIQGQMQFGHDGAGTNAGGTVSPVANLVDVPIQGNSFSQSAVDQNAGNGLNSFGVTGFFAGPNAEEVGGTAWMHLDDGSYNGVFRAGQ